MINWKKEKIADNFLVTDYVANGSFASLSENVTYISTPDYAILVRTTDYTKKWNGKYIYVSKNSFDFLKKSSLILDDLIIANVGDPGKAFLCPDLGQPMTLGPNSILVRPLDKKKIFNKYFYYYTTSKIGQRQIQDICSATAQKKFNKTSYRGLEFPLPSLPQQQKIAAILDAADALRQNDKALIAKYDELTQALFLDMFGDPVSNPKEWEKVELATLCSKITDGTHKTPKYLEEGVIFLSAKNIKNFELNCLNPKYISINEHKELSKRCPVAFGDILLTKSGSLGMAAMVEFDFEFSIFESLALIKYQEDKIIGKFLLYFMNTQSTQFQYNDITKGVGVKHLHLTDIRKLITITPPLRLQNQFAERIAIIEEQKAIAQASLVKSEELFSSLLQKAFKGEL